MKTIIKFLVLMGASFLPMSLMAQEKSPEAPGKEKKAGLTAEILDFEYEPGSITFDPALKALLKIEEREKK